MKRSLVVLEPTSGTVDKNVIVGWHEDQLKIIGKEGSVMLTLDQKQVAELKEFLQQDDQD